MPHEVSFHLKWLRKQGLTNPEYWATHFWLKPRIGNGDFNHVYRRVDFSLTYFLPGEYIDPLSQQPVNQGVVDIIQRERVATKSWQPRQRLDLKRWLYIQYSPEDKWSPVNKYNFVIQRGTPYQELQYIHPAGDRSHWFPNSVTFFLCDPMLVYVSTEGSNSNLLYATFPSSRLFGVD